MSNFKEIFKSDLLVVEQAIPDRYFAVEVTASNANKIANFIAKELNCKAPKVVTENNPVVPVLAFSQIDIEFWPITVNVGTYLIKHTDRWMFCSQDFFNNHYQPSFSHLLQS